jgi:hypothetical protein
MATINTLTVQALVLTDRIRGPRQMILYPLEIWLGFAFALHSSLADTVLVLPIVTTATMIYLASFQGGQSLELRELPRPVSGWR